MDTNPDSGVLLRSSCWKNLMLFSKVVPGGLLRSSIGRMFGRFLLRSYYLVRSVPILHSYTLSNIDYGPDPTEPIRTFFAFFNNIRFGHVSVRSDHSHFALRSRPPVSFVLHLISLRSCRIAVPSDYESEGRECTCVCTRLHYNISISRVVG